MPSGPHSTRVVPITNLREFFKDELHGALEKQQLAVEDQTEHYVVNLLTLFSRSEALYEQTSEGRRLKPLVLMLSEALEGEARLVESTEERSRLRARLGLNKSDMAQSAMAGKSSATRRKPGQRRPTRDPIGTQSVYANAAGV